MGGRALRRKRERAKQRSFMSASKQVRQHGHRQHGHRHLEGQTWSSLMTGAGWRKQQGGEGSPNAQAIGRRPWYGIRRRVPEGLQHAALTVGGLRSCEHSQQHAQRRGCPRVRLLQGLKWRSGGLPQAGLEVYTIGQLAEALAGCDLNREV